MRIGTDIDENYTPLDNIASFIIGVIIMLPLLIIAIV